MPEAMIATYHISAKHRWYLRVWSSIAVTIGVTAALAPGEWDGSFWRAAVVTVSAAVVLCLVSADYRMGRTVETNERAICFRKPSGRTTSVAWEDIEQIVNHPAYGVLHVRTASGETFIVDHQFENVQSLVDEIVTRTGKQVTERVPR